MKEINFPNPGGIHGLSKSKKLTKKEKADILSLVKEDTANLNKNEIFQERLYALKLALENYLDYSHKYISVGVFVQYLIDTFNISNTRFAKLIGFNISNLSAIMNEKRVFSIKLAIILGYISNTSPLLWIKIRDKNNIQKLSTEISSMQKTFFENASPNVAKNLSKMYKGKLAL